MPRLNEKLDAGILREPSFGPISLDLKSRTIKDNETNKIERLSAQEYQIVWLLVRSNGAVLSQSEIENFLYEDLPESKDVPLGNTLDVQLNRLRAKLDELTAGKIKIENMRNVGWRIVHSS